MDNWFKLDLTKSSDITFNPFVNNQYEIDNEKMEEEQPQWLKENPSIKKH